MQCLSTMQQVRRDICIHPSIAEDSGTISRTTIHFFERLLNKMDQKIEISDVQAAAGLLGLNAVVSSDTFICYHGGQHIHYIDSLRNLKQIDKDSSQHSDIELGSEDSVSSSDTDTLYSLEDTTDDEATDEIKISEKFSKQHHSKVYKKLFNMGSKEIPEQIAVQFAEFYHFRGVYFKNMNRFEYNLFVNVIPKKKEATTKSSSGRKANKTFEFGLGCPIKAKFTQRLNSKQPVTQFIGKMPKYVCKNPSTPDEKKRADEFAKFWLITLRPETHLYDSTGDINFYKYDWEDFLIWKNTCEKSNDLIDRGRYQVLLNAYHSIYSNKQAQRLQKAYFSRNRTIWKNETKTKVASDPFHVDIDPIDKATVDDIEDLKAKTPHMYTHKQLLKYLQRVEQVEKYRNEMTFLIDLPSRMTPMTTRTNKCKISVPILKSVQSSKLGKLQLNLQNPQYKPSGKGSNCNNPFCCKPLPKNLKGTNNISSQRYRHRLKKAIIDEHIPSMKLSDDKIPLVQNVGLHFIESKVCGSQKGFHYLLTGPPGAGKSRTIYGIQSVVLKLVVGSIISASFMGLCAAVIDGETLHRIASITTKDIDDKESINLRPFNNAEKVLFKEKYGHVVALIIVDEISMVAPYLLGLLLQRLREIYGDEAVDNMSFLFCGDFNQNDMGCPLAEEIVKVHCYQDNIYAVKNINYGEKARSKYDVGTTTRTAIDFFKTFKRYELKIQNRSVDEIHSKHLKDAYTHGVISRNMLSSFKPLEKNLFSEDDSWSKATVICRYNIQVKVMEYIMALNFAQRTNNVVIRWNMSKIVFNDGTEYDPHEQVEYDGKHPIFWQIFVLNMDAFVTSNFEGNFDIFNGTKVSLSFEKEEEKDYLSDRIKQSKPGDVIDLPFQPMSVNVKLFPNTEHYSKLATDWNRDDTLVTGEIIVPIQKFSYRKAQTYVIRFSSAAQHVTCYAPFPFESAFATTNIKCQSRTMDKIIVLCGIKFNTQPSLTNTSFTFKQAFTTFSRVRRATDVRMLTTNDETTKYLLKMKRSHLTTAYLSSWITEYDGEKDTGFEILHEGNFERYLEFDEKRKSK